MRKYVKVENNLITSYIIIESNIVAAYPEFDPNNPEALGFKEVLDIPPELTPMQTAERNEFSLKEDGRVTWDYTIIDVTTEQLVNALIRQRRAFELASSDWTQFPDSPLSSEKKAEWATYRQAMRDLPSLYPNLTFDTEIVWPTAPTN
jgi:hypothetical protein